VRFAVKESDSRKAKIPVVAHISSPKQGFTVHKT